MKRITIEYDGFETSIKWSDNVTPIEALGMLRYHEKNVFVGLLNYNQTRKEDEIVIKKDEILISDLNISRRLYNRLKENNINTLLELEKLSKLDLLKFRKFGVRLANEVELILKEYNLNLK